VSDLNVVAVLVAKPGAEGIVAAALHDLVVPTRAEAGCLSYEVFTSAVSPQTFVAIERWRSQEDLDAHQLTPHVRAALAAAGSHLAAAPQIHPLIADER